MANNFLLSTWKNNNKTSHVHKKKHEKFVFESKQIKDVETTNFTINNNMQSIFEQLVEKVMSDEELNIIGAEGADDEVDASADIEETDNESGSEDVTVTLTADQVECLRSILDQIDGADIYDENESDDSEDEDVSIEDTDEAEEFDAFTTEAIEAEEIGTPLVNMKKGSPCKPSAGCNKVQGKVTSMAKSGKADSSVTDKIGNDGDEGTPLVNMKKGNPKKPSAGDNKVAGRASQVGSDLFA